MPDAHGLLGAQAIADFRGVDLIIHAGNMGKEKVFEELFSQRDGSFVR